MSAKRGASSQVFAGKTFVLIGAPTIKDRTELIEKHGGKICNYIRENVRTKLFNNLKFEVIL